MMLSDLTDRDFQRAFAVDWRKWDLTVPGALTAEDAEIHAEYIAEARRRNAEHIASYSAERSRVERYEGGIEAVRKQKTTPALKVGQGRFVDYRKSHTKPLSIAARKRLVDVAYVVRGGTHRVPGEPVPNMKDLIDPAKPMSQ